MKRYLFLSVFFWSLGVFAQNDEAKPPKIGPINVSENVFSNIYFFREKEDDFPDNWIGIFQKGNKGLSAKISLKNIYLVHTVSKGSVEFCSKIDEVFSIPLNLSPGENYYVDCILTKKSNGKPYLDFVVLSKEDGKKRLSNYHKKIKERFCLIPWPSDEDFVSDCYNDTIYWFAKKDKSYKFKYIPSWETILRSTLRTVCGFRNENISKTFSETGGILNLPKSKFKTKEDFIEYSNTDLKREIIVKKDLSSQNSLVWEVESIEFLPWVKYAVKIYNSIIPLNEYELQTRTCLIFFYWEDENKNGSSSCLFTSERGLSIELNSKEQITNKLLESWRSLSLIDKKNK